MTTMKYAGTEITQESIVATRQHFADIHHACIRLARSRDGASLNDGEFYVNDLPGYIEKEAQHARDALAGLHDHSFTFAQRAHWLQTGECVAMLP